MWTETQESQLRELLQLKHEHETQVAAHLELASLLQAGTRYQTADFFIQHATEARRLLMPFDKEYPTTLANIRRAFRNEVIVALREYEKVLIDPPPPLRPRPLRMDNILRVIENVDV